MVPILGDLSGGWQSLEILDEKRNKLVAAAGTQQTIFLTTKSIEPLIFRSLLRVLLKPVSDMDRAELGTPPFLAKSDNVLKLL